jgi:hypothetical protein
MDCLPDPYDDRVVKKLPTPPQKTLSDAILFPYTGKEKDKPDWKALKTHLLLEGTISKAHVVKLVKTIIAMMSKCFSDHLRERIYFGECI